MSADMPWNVNGVEPEAREAARMAARRKGIPVGQWLTQTILTSASQELKHSSRRNGAGHNGTGSGTDDRSDDDIDPSEDPDVPDLVQRSQEARSNGFGAAKDAPIGRSGPPALTPEAILESIQKLAARVEDAETRTTEVIEPLADRIASLDDQIGEIKQRGPVSTAPVERAMMRLTERLEKLEGGGSSDDRRGLMEKLFSRG